MKISGKYFLMAVMSASMLTACGFKSDLFLPGIPGLPGGADKYEDPEELPTLDSLNTPDTEIFKKPDVEVAIPVSVAEPVAEPVAIPVIETPEVGVPVLIEPLSEEEIRKIKEKNKI